MKRRIGVLSVLLLIAAACLGIFVLAPHEPSYKGKSLSYWLRKIDDGDRQDGVSWVSWTNNGSVEAREAIQQMGTNAIPFLLLRLTNSNPNLRNKLLTLLAKQHLIKFPLPQTNYLHRATALAFDALGPAGKDAVPDLVAVLRSQHFRAGDDRQKCAAIALVAIDPEGRAALMPFVRSNGWNGTCAIWGLASHRADVPPEVIQYLIAEVTTTNINIFGQGAICAWALGALRQDPEQVIPALIQAFNSQDRATRWGAAYGLRLWGTNATSAIPVLAGGLKDPDSTIRTYAKRALKEIDPKGNYDKDENYGIHLSPRN